MIGKIKKGKSFGGCIRYVMGKDNAEIIGSDGVLLGNNCEIADSFNCQCLLNPKIKQPVGHIALSFKPEDKPVLSNEFMAKIAMEYMDLMGIRNTQFILVRHHHTDNPHCHLVYNRIGYDGKVISSQGDYKRNEIATKRLKDKYGLTYAEDKGKTNVAKLHDSERIKYEIHHAVKQALKRARTWKELVVGLALQGIKLEFVGRGGKMKTAGDIQGIRFTKDGLTFKGSQISREFSFAKLNAILGGNRQEIRQDLEVKKQNQAPSNRNRKEQEPSNTALVESNGLGLFSSFGEFVPEEQMEPATTAKPVYQIYAKESNSMILSSIQDTYQKGKSIYRLTMSEANAYTAEVSICIEQEEVKQRILKFDSQYLEPICSVTRSSNDPTQVLIKTTGTAERIGEEWKVIKPITVEIK